MKRRPDLFLLLLLVAGGYGLAWYLTGGQRPADRLAALPVLGRAMDCDLSETACDGGGLRLRLLDPAEPLQPVRFVIESEGDIRPEAVYLEMQGMDMGLNRFRVEPAGEHWAGVLMVPVCTTGRRDWLVQVVARRGEQLGRWVFRASF